MKRLILVRHGKAEEPSPTIPDFERSLTIKGKTISHLMARKFRDTGSEPGLIITSPAFRALETALIFASESGIRPDKLILDNNLYHHVNVDYIKEMLSEYHKEVNTVTLFGHNPSFTEIACSLCNGKCDFMPKSGVISMTFNTAEWSKLKKGAGIEEFYLKPDILL